MCTGRHACIQHWCADYIVQDTFSIDIYSRHLWGGYILGVLLKAVNNTYQAEKEGDEIRTY